MQRVVAKSFSSLRFGKVSNQIEMQSQYTTRTYPPQEWEHSFSVKRHYCQMALHYPQHEDKCAQQLGCYLKISFFIALQKTFTQSAIYEYLWVKVVHLHRFLITLSK